MVGALVARPPWTRIDTGFAPPRRLGPAVVSAGPEFLGRWALATIGRVRPGAAEPASPDAARTVGWAILAGAAGLLLAGPTGLGLAAVPLGVAARSARRARRRAARALADGLPEVLDLLALAVGAGLTVPLAVTAVGRRAQGPVAEALADAVEGARQGQRLADALDSAGSRLGAEARPLFGALAASERYGAPLGPSLDRQAAEARADRRRRAEERARRVPVLLLFPLVLCVLPAFGLLTVVPLLGGAIQSLRLG
jgi:tight adherence protein C